ncbi:ATP-grasp domain-containing protein [Candidatus Woesearchaeota archaeon]|nr:ATP-grasp domain-containing protein [Candidatus Woesearchaeota archaeon]
MDAPEAGALAGKTILFVNSGSKKKSFTLETAKRLGMKIVLVNKSCTWQKRYVDHFIQADTYVHNEVVSKLSEFFKKNKVDGAVTFWEDDVPLLAKLCDEFGFIGPSMETAEKARNKASMRAAFASGNVPSAKHYLIVPNGNGGLKAAMEAVGFPAVLKPCWGSDSEFVIKVNDEAEAEAAYEYVKKSAVPRFNPIFKYNNSHFLFEEYLSGPEVNVESITQNGETRVVSVSDKMPMEEPYFMERGDYMPSRYSGEILGRIKEVVRVAHKAIGARNCISHTEVKVTSDGPKVVEIAVRMGGDYLWDWVKTVWGVDLVEQALRIAVGLPVNFEELARPKCYLVGKYFIPEYSGVVSTIRIKGGADRLPYVKTLNLLKTVGDPVLVPPQGYENMGWLVTTGESHIEAEKNLNSVMDDIKITVLRFRSTSSIGQSKRKNAICAASVQGEDIVRGAKIEKIRMIPEEGIPKLNVGILCNLYEDGASDSCANGAAVEKDLMSVGKNIQEALESRGHKVVFFDMNESPLPFKKIANSGVDIVFNVCERINNSSLLEPHSAAMLDMLGIPYTGSNPQTLAVCIDKIRMKKLLHFHDIPTPKWDYIYDINDELDEELRFPLIVKPANADNSIGITNDSVVTNPDELNRQLKKVVVDEGRPALVEEYIEGDEYDVSIVGNDDDLLVLPLSRSMFEDMPKGFWHIYPFDAKWTDADVYEKIKVERPAKIPRKLASLITEIAIDTYNILDAHDYGRVEIRVDKDGNPYVIELNPNPSINKGDCTPNCAELIGLDFPAFIEKILWQAIKRYKGKPPYFHLRTSTNI